MQATNGYGYFIDTLTMGVYRTILNCFKCEISYEKNIPTFVDLVVGLALTIMSYNKYSDKIMCNFMNVSFFKYKKPENIKIKRNYILISKSQGC